MNYLLLKLVARRGGGGVGGWKEEGEEEGGQRWGLGSWCGGEGLWWRGEKGEEHRAARQREGFGGGERGRGPPPTTSSSLLHLPSRTLLFSLYLLPPPRGRAVVVEGWRVGEGGVLLEGRVEGGMGMAGPEG